jgi:protein-S-isoprenylcysteine O-methyltransferase Ste14
MDIAVMDNVYLTLGLVAIVAMGDVVWIVTDPRSSAERRRRPMSLTWPRATAALLPQVAGGLLWPWPATAWNPIFAAAGIAVLSIGMGLALWARRVMGARWAPPDAHDVGRQPDLITTAPFSWSRNPIYLGVSLIVLGYAIAVRSSFLFVVAALVWSLRRSALREEALLERHFGAVYTAYKQRVPRFIF